jgi:hypothetical protein
VPGKLVEIVRETINAYRFLRGKTLENCYLEHQEKDGLLTR